LGDARVDGDNPLTLTASRQTNTVLLCAIGGHEITCRSCNLPRAGKEAEPDIDRDGVGGSGVEVDLEFGSGHHVGIVDAVRRGRGGSEPGCPSTSFDGSLSTCRIEQRIRDGDATTGECSRCALQRAGVGGPEFHHQATGGADGFVENGLVGNPFSRAILDGRWTERVGESHASTRGSEAPALFESSFFSSFPGTRGFAL